MPHMNKGACLNTGSVAYFEKKFGGHWCFLQFADIILLFWCLRFQIQGGTLWLTQQSQETQPNSTGNVKTLNP